MACHVDVIGLEGWDKAGERTQPDEGEGNSDHARVIRKRVENPTGLRPNDDCSAAHETHINNQGSGRADGRDDRRFQYNGAENSASVRSESPQNRDVPAAGIH